MLNPIFGSSELAFRGPLRRGRGEYPELLRGDAAKKRPSGQAFDRRPELLRAPSLLNNMAVAPKTGTKMDPW